MAKELMTKNFPVFDCDSHIVEPATIRSTRMNMVGKRTIAIDP